jgi:hypothetical protein
MVIVMESREQRITTLATTLRSSGIAKSDSQAKMMAEDMIGVEEHVQKDYEVEHTRANDYLQTAKNLGTPRQTFKPIQPVQPISSSNNSSTKQEVRPQETKQEPSRRIEPILNQTTTQGNRTNSTNSHDTHNSALEAIKAQISGSSFNETNDVRNSAVSQETVEPEKMESEVIDIPHTEYMDIADLHNAANTAQLTPNSEPITSARLSEIKLPESVSIELPVSEEPKLDAKKLVEMMEEDGKLEEHTREIKEKPKDVKPKEEYAENSIDLGSMFDFNKGTVRK